MPHCRENPAHCMEAPALQAFFCGSVVAIVCHLHCPAFQEHFDRPRGRGRRPRVDPRTLDVESLTGQENVSVVDRETGKKVRGGSRGTTLGLLDLWRSRLILSVIIRS